MNGLLMYMSIFLMAVTYVLHYKTIRRPFALFFLMYYILLLSTIINNGDIGGSLKHCIKILLLCLLVGTVVDDEKRTDTFLHAVRDITLVFFVFHCITMIVYPNGIPKFSSLSTFPLFVYGSVNSTIRAIFPGMCCSSILDIREKKLSVATLIFFFGQFYCFFAIYHTSTTLIAICFILCCYLFKKVMSRNIRKIYFISIIGVFVLQITIIILSNVNFIEFIADLFQKSSDFSGRTLLWDNTLLSILANPIIGRGQQTTDVIVREIGNVNGAHNYYLDLTYQRGILGLLVFFVIIVQPFKLIKKESKVSDTVFILVVYCCACLIMFLSEPFFEYEYNVLPIFYALLLTQEKDNHTVLSGA